jgi:hypothetical protein
LSMSMRLLIFFFTFSYCFTFSVCFGQTKVTGKVVDLETREPLPFVSIAFKGTTSGTTTDFDGNFSISIEKNVDSLLASYVGYNRAAKKVRVNQTQIINFELSKSSVGLQEVVIKPGENPAHPIVRKALANKDNNDKEKLSAYQYEVYNKIEFDLNNITEDFKKKKVFKPFEFVFENIDSTSVGEKPYLPMFISENLSDFFYRKQPKKRKEIIKGSKISGVENSSVSEVMGDMYQNVNIYDNSILVFDKNFISPISDNGFFYYRYYLIDSVRLDNHWCYQIQFMPKRKQELTFTGNMWINDTTFAIKRLEMKIAEDANINFVKALNVVQDYKNVDGAWMLAKDRLVIDFEVRKDKMGIYGRKTTSYKDFVINKPKDDDFYEKTPDVLLLDGADQKDKAFWEASRHDSLSKNEKQIYAMVDTIQTLPAYKTYVDIITIFVSGYKDIGKIELGPYFNTYSFNKVEGNRFRIGGRTTNAFSRWHELNGYVAYGTHDNDFKYSLGFRSFLTKKPRQILSANYKKDLEILGQSQNAFTNDNILASLLRKQPLNNMTRLDQYTVGYEYEWFEGFNQKLSVINRRLTPLEDLPFRYERITSDGSIDTVHSLITSEVRFLTRFAWHEKYLKGEFDRVNLGTIWPVLQLQYTAGIKGIFSSDYAYHKVNFNLNDRIRINPIGYTDYIVDFGQVFGKAPYPLMELHGGNETYTYDPFAFNMMNYYEFVSDKYASLSIFHHFDGFFFNKVPLFRKLKWREVATFKGLTGTVSAANRNIFRFPSTLSTLSKGPYYEAGVGIENIFKIFRIDALWRLSYIDKDYVRNYESRTGSRISEFGIRGSLQLTF